MMTTEPKDPLWREADGIYQRWTNEEFDIEAEKATKIMYSFTIETETLERGGFLNPGPKKKTETTSKVIANVLDRLTTCLTEWSAKRLIETHWVTPARNLIQAYNVARGHHLLIPGLAIRKDLQEREHRIAELDAELQESKKRAGELEKQLLDCASRATALDKENRELKKAPKVKFTSSSLSGPVEEEK